MKHQVRFLMLIAAILIVFILTGCDNKTQNQTKNIENNGGMYVKYGDDIYYREYTQTSEEEKCIWANYWYKANEPKMVKKLKADGTTEDLFMDNGYGTFYLIDERFFGNADGILYTVNLKGEDYIKLGEGAYLQAEEENHKLYFIDRSYEGHLFVLDTLSLKSKELVDKNNADYLCVYHGNAYYPIYSEDEVTKFDIMKYNFETKDESYLTTLNDTRNEEDEYLSIYDRCYIDDFIVKENKLYALVGIREGTGRFFGSGNIFAINLDTGETTQLATNVDEKMVLDGDRLYYSDINMELGQYPNFYHSINVNTKEVFEEDALFPFDFAKDNVKVSVAEGNQLMLVFQDGTKKFVFASSDEANLESKYLSQYAEEERYVDIREIEILDHKVFYKVQASVLDPETDIGWRLGYKHIASEIHIFDLDNHTDRVLYSYEI